MSKHSDSQSLYQPPESNLTLQHLNAFVGEWTMALSIPTDPPTVLRGLWTTFEWMEGGLFLVWRWGPARPDFPGGLFPVALSVISYDDSTKGRLI
jgi:hypothetical protein